MGNGESSQIEPSGFSCKLWSTFYGFSSGHVWMWELDHKECWVPKNWCFQTVVLEKTLESPLDRKEIKPVNPKGNQPWVFTGRTDAEAETPILWPFYAKSQLIGKDPDVGKYWGQGKRGWQRMRRLDDITNSMDMSLSKLQEMVKDRKPGVLQSVHGVSKSHTWLRDWTTIYNARWLLTSYRKVGTSPLNIKRNLWTQDYSSPRCQNTMFVESKSFRHSYKSKNNVFAFDTCVGPIREWQPTPVFLPGESHRQRSHGLQSMGPQRVGHNWATNTHRQWLCIRKGHNVKRHLRNFFLSFYFWGQHPQK